MKNINKWLVYAIVIPLVILFWPMPYKPWNDFVDWILFALPTTAAQILFCRVGKRKAVKVIPAVLTGMWAAWGIYLVCWHPVSNSIGRRLYELLRVSVSPFLCCLVVLAVFRLRKKAE